MKTERASSCALAGGPRLHLDCQRLFLRDAPVEEDFQMNIWRAQGEKQQQQQGRPHFLSGSDEVKDGRRGAAQKGRVPFEVMCFELPIINPCIMEGG